MRSVIGFVLDRVADYKAHKDLQCTYGAPRSRRGKPVAAELRKRRSCLRLLKRVIADETARRVGGVWWVNRQISMALGRLARRGGVPYHKL